MTLWHDVYVIEVWFFFFLQWFLNNWYKFWNVFLLFWSLSNLFFFFFPPYIVPSFPFTESPQTDDSDEAQLYQSWFKLVLEKNRLARYESELMIL